MKNSILLLFFLIASNCIAKEPNKIKKIENNKSSLIDEKVDSKVERMGYIGITAAIAFPRGDFNRFGPSNPLIGARISPINFGYRFTKTIGICASWFHASNTIDNSYNSNINSPWYFGKYSPWVYGSIMIGPLIRIPISNRFELDFRPMVGYTYINLSSPEFPFYVPDSYYKSSSLGYNLGSAFSFHISEYFSLLLTADLFYTNTEVGEDVIDDFGNPVLNTFDQTIYTFSPGLGLAYRIK